MNFVDLDLRIKEFEELKTKAKDKANKEYSSLEEMNKYYCFSDLEMEEVEEEVEGKTLKASGILKTEDGEELGFVSFRIPLDLNKLIDIFQIYIKKLNKVKTVMESVKEE